MQGHHVVFIQNQKEARRLLEEIGIDEGGYPYLIPKAIFHSIKLKQISCIAANIIKQEMLSKGGEAAVKRETLVPAGYTDVLLMGTLKQYRLLVRKLKLQPFGLKDVAEEIENMLNALDPKPRVIELANDKQLVLGKKALIMGILNVTPDSFSDGGRYNNVDSAVKRAREMIAEGADIIDIGGASARPQSKMVGEKEELARVLPVVEQLAGNDIILSIDTFRATVAAECLKRGAHIINDIGRLQLDSGLLDILIKYNSPVILMHNRMQFNQDRRYEDLIADIIEELQESINQARKAGLAETKIIVDPGIGFGKSVAENLILVKRLAEFRSLGKPLLIGASRKSFIGKTLNVEVDARMEGSLAVAVMGVMNGADIVRVHDVKQTRLALDMVDAVRCADG